MFKFGKSLLAPAIVNLSKVVKTFVNEKPLVNGKFFVNDKLFLKDKPVVVSEKPVVVNEKPLVNDKLFVNEKPVVVSEVFFVAEGPVVSEATPLRERPLQYYTEQFRDGLAEVGIVLNERVLKQLDKDKLFNENVGRYIHCISYADDNGQFTNTDRHAATQLANLLYQLDPNNSSKIMDSIQPEELLPKPASKVEAVTQAKPHTDKLVSQAKLKAIRDSRSDPALYRKVSPDSGNFRA